MRKRKPDIEIHFNGGIESAITFKSGDNFTLKAVGRFTASVEPSEVDINWYFNGNYVGSSSRVWNQNSISSVLRRTSSTYLYDGFYEAQLVWYMNLKCSFYYSQLRGYSRKILARSSVEVKYYGKW